MHIVIYGIIVLFEVIFYRQADLFWNTVFLWKIQWNKKERAAMFTFILAPLGKDYLYLSGWALEK